MQSLVDQGKIAGGVTMMARHGKVIHLKAVGMADREAGKAMQTDAIFRIASMSKPITTVAIMKLYEQGKLDLDDAVSKYIPEFKNPEVLVSVKPLRAEPAKREITIRHLLTHTSGLGSTFTDKLGPIYARHGIDAGLRGTPATLEQVIKNLAGQPLIADPGETWEYGKSTDVLGRVVEVASGVPLDRFIEDQICRPLGMEDTFFRVPDDGLSRLVAAYVPVDTCLRKVKQGEVLKQGPDASSITITSDYCYRKSNKYLAGGSGLCSTAKDYMRLCQMLLNGGQLDGKRLLQEKTVEMMTTNQTGDLPIRDLPDQFGFGFTIYPDTKEVHEQLRDAYAWFGYWSTSFRISPRGDWILITMSQLAWDAEVTPTWFREYERLAAESIER
jgi:CubicO group peptidase (beta-lactamase class C family)